MEDSAIAHIPEGVVDLPVLVGGIAATAILVTMALRRLEPEQLPQTAMLTAVFFIVSLISIPIGPGGIHLLLNGLMGLVLGWAAAPAILVALAMQAVLVGHGGLLVLGVNAFNVILPALLCAVLFRPLLQGSSRMHPFHIGAVAGSLGVLLSGALVTTTLVFSGDEFIPLAKLVLLSYLPVTVVEAAVSGACVAFLCRVSPRLLDATERA